MYEKNGFNCKYLIIDLLCSRILALGHVREFLALQSEVNLLQTTQYLF